MSKPLSEERAMTEREIFLDALDLPDAAARATYLESACGGRPALRKRVEELLQSHLEADTFLKVPAVEQVIGAEESLSFLKPTAEPGSLGRLDHYEVLEVVGRGGAGVVLRARDTKLLRAVAIKALAPRLASSSKARQLFVREAQAAAAVRDDHVVAIHAVSDEGRIPYLVMEFVDGMTLQERIGRTGPLKLAEVLRIGMQLAKGLAAAHAQGVVHRDIKPANILLENGVQRVKITDFGLAGLADSADGQGGAVLAGTPAFMSPEQARGEATDERSDLFSLGSVLYTLCAGRPPFVGGSTAQVLQAVSEQAAPPLDRLHPEVPSWLCALIHKLHAKQAGERSTSAREVAELLSTKLAHLQQPAREPLPPVGPPSQAPAEPATSLPRFWGWLRRRRVFVTLAILLLGFGLPILLKLGQHGMTASRDGAAVDETLGSLEPLELRREDVPYALLVQAGGGDPALAPAELAGVLGDGRFLLPRAGRTAWLEQSPDGKVLAVPLDEDVVLFDVPTGEYLRTLKGPGGRVFSVAFSRDSRLLAAATRQEESGGAVQVWDLQANRVLLKQPQPGSTISCAVVFSGDGRNLFTESAGRVLVWDMRSGQKVQEIELGSKGIGSMSFNPQRQRLAVAAWPSQTVKEFDWSGAKLAERQVLRSVAEPVWAAAYSPDGNYLAIGNGQQLKLFDAAKSVEGRSIQTAAERLAFTPDGRTLYAAAPTGRDSPVHTTTRWDVTSLQPLPALPVRVSAEPDKAFQCLSRDGKVLYLTKHFDATGVLAIETRDGKELFPRPGHIAGINAVAISPDGKLLASAGEDHVIKLWDLASGRVLYSLTAHSQPVWGLSFCPNGKLLASGSRDGTIGLWDVHTGTLLRAILGHSRSPSRIQFSPDGTTVAAGSEHGQIRRWNVATGVEASSLHGSEAVVHCVAHSGDGKWLASGGDRVVRLHNLATGESQPLTVPNAVHQVVFSHDSHALAAAGGAPKASVYLWDLQTSQRTTWKGHSGDVYDVAFSPAGSLLASCGGDGTVRLWDTSPNPDQVKVIGPGPFGGPVRSVAFTPDGRYLATANANGMVYLLRVDATAKSGPVLVP